MADPFKMSFPSFHPLFRGGREPFPSGVDCALLLDVVVPWMPGESEPLPDARIISLDLDPTQSMTPVYEFPSDLSITADSSKAIPALLEEVKRQMTPEQRHRAEARRAAHEESGRRRLAERIDAAQRDGHAANLTTRWVSYQIGQTLEQDAIILHELTDSSLFNRQQPGQFTAPAARASAGRPRRLWVSRSLRQTGSLRLHAAMDRGCSRTQPLPPGRRASTRPRCCSW